MQAGSTPLNLAAAACVERRPCSRRSRRRCRLRRARRLRSRHARRRLHCARRPRSHRLRRAHRPCSLTLDAAAAARIVLKMLDEKRERELTPRKDDAKEMVR